MSEFKTLGLCHTLLSSISELGYQTPTEVQTEAIPHALAGRDLLVGAQTGTGKTAAFALPIIQSLAQGTDERRLRALIVVPTRELAQQVYESFHELSSDTNLVTVAAYGGTSIRVQTSRLAKGCDILIATPGRLLDHLYCGNITLKHLSTLVFDEADRMLDMGFLPDIKRILKRCKPERQTMFFSATFDKKIKNIAYEILSDPVEIQVSPSNSTATTVEQLVYPVDRKRKAELLAFLIGSRNWQQVLVFTKTKQGSDQLAKELALDGIKAASINGDKSQGARQKALDDFKNGKVRALIATDVAARGLDIEKLEQVVNFDMPYKPEDYVHRIGRTGRAGQIGIAISLMSPNEEDSLLAIERLIDTKLPQEWLKGFEPSLDTEMNNEKPPRKRGRNSEKQKMKARLKIHANRGKKN